MDSQTLQATKQAVKAAAETLIRDLHDGLMEAIDTASSAGELSDAMRTAYTESQSKIQVLCGLLDESKALASSGWFGALTSAEMVVEAVQKSHPPHSKGTWVGEVMADDRKAAAARKGIISVEPIQRGAPEVRQILADFEAGAVKAARVLSTPGGQKVLRRLVVNPILQWGILPEKKGKK